MQGENKGTYLSQTELEAVTKQAEQSGMTISKWIKLAIKEKLERVAKADGNHD